MKPPYQYNIPLTYKTLRHSIEEPCGLIKFPCSSLLRHPVERSRPSNQHSSSTTSCIRSFKLSRQGKPPSYQTSLIGLYSAGSQADHWDRLMKLTLLTDNGVYDCSSLTRIRFWRWPWIQKCNFITRLVREHFARGSKA